MASSDLAIEPVFQWGEFVITNTVVTTWIIMLLVSLLSVWITRRLARQPGRLQTAMEAIVSMMESAIAEVAPQHARRLLPFIGSLWVFLVVANLCSLIPGVHSPTRDLSATAALALLVFLSSHWYALRMNGTAYLRHYVTPSPILLPFHIISELTRTVALAVRLFGNMMSLEMAALLILLVAGFLAPVPILMLHVVEALVQAYIFGMLALIYVAGSLQSQPSLQSQSSLQSKE